MTEDDGGMKMTRSEFIESLIEVGTKPNTDRANLARHMEIHIRSGFITPEDKEKIWAVIHARSLAQWRFAEAFRRGRTIDEVIGHLGLSVSFMTEFKDEHIGRAVNGGLMSAEQARWKIVEMTYAIRELVTQMDILRSRPAGIA